MSRGRRVSIRYIALTYERLEVDGLAGCTYELRRWLKG
jgi:hypothetical protein